MSSKRYTEEFKIEAVKQVTERGYYANEVAKRRSPGSGLAAPLFKNAGTAFEESFFYIWLSTSLQ